MSQTNQSNRLTNQQKENHGAAGIFGTAAQLHDAAVSQAALFTMKQLQSEHPNLKFRHRKSISKLEINKALQKLDPDLGKTLFVPESSIKPDGGIIEVQDTNGNWRIVLVSEAKHQGNDIENIKQGKLVGKNNDQDLMAAGNAIERAHKNISEIANLMLAESYFPYIIFLEGSNFLTKDVIVTRPDGRNVELKCNSGFINRLDRLSAANYGMAINVNLCKNKFISTNGRHSMLQAASIFTKNNGEKWPLNEMIDIMLDVARTSLYMLKNEL